MAHHFDAAAYAPGKQRTVRGSTREVTDPCMLSAGVGVGTPGRPAGSWQMAAVLVVCGKGAAFELYLTGPTRRCARRSCRIRRMRTCGYLHDPVEPARAVSAVKIRNRGRVG